MKPTAEPSLKSIPDRLREALYPLAFVLSIGSLWGFAWSQHRVDISEGHEYYPPIIDETGRCLGDIVGQDIDDVDEIPIPPGTGNPVATIEFGE